MALSNLLLRIAGDGDDAKRELASVAKDMADLGRKDAEARVDIETAGANAKLEQLKKRLENLQRQEATPSVQIRSAAVVAQIERIEAKLAALDAKRVNVNVDVDRSSIGMIGRLTGAFAGLLASLGGSGGSGIIGGAARVSAGFVSFGVSMGPVVILVGALAAVIAVQLVGALTALIASLAAAAAAIGALAVAFAAALGPAVALAIAVFARLVKIVEALKAQDKAAADTTKNAAQAHQQAADAAARRLTAERNLADAVKQRGLAEAQAFREMQDAAEAATDAVRSLEQAQLSMQGAELATQQAKLALKNFRNEAGLAGKAFDTAFKQFDDVKVDPSGLRNALEGAAGGGLKLSADDELKLEQLILDVKQARLSEKDAVDGVSDSERNLARARQDAARFAKEGIKASSSYAASLRAVQAAQEALTAASKDPTMASSLATAKQLTDDLSKSEKRLLGAIKSVRGALSEAFGPAVSAVVDALARALRGLPALLKPLRPAIKRLGDAWAGVIDSFGKELVKPSTAKALTGFFDAAAKIAKPLGTIMGAFFLALSKIATAAMPFLISGLQTVATLLGDWAKNTSVAEMSDAIKGLVGHLKVWVGIGGDLAASFLDFLKGAAPAGLELARSIARIAKKLKEWVESDKGREQIRRFFEETVPTVQSFVHFLVLLGRNLKFVFIDIPKAIGGLLVGAFNDAVGAIKRLAGWAVTLKEKFMAVVHKIGDVINKIAAMPGAVWGAVEDIASAIGDLPSKAWHWGVDMVNGLINGIKEKANDAIEAAKGLAKDVEHAITHPWEILSPSKLFHRIGAYATEGLANGLLSGAQAVSDAARMSMAAPVLNVAGPGGDITPRAVKSAGAHAAGRSGTVIENLNLPPGPAGAVPDARWQAMQLERLMAGIGRGA